MGKFIDSICNVSAGEHFARTLRALRVGSPSGADSTDWFSLDDMIGAADEFNLAGVFSSSGSHWRLVLGFNPNGTLRVYDPLSSVGGSHVYDRTPQSSDVSMPSWPLQAHYGLSHEILTDSEANRLDTLRAAGYDMNITTNFKQEGLQKDGHNCGPLVLYGAMVANKYTPGFENVPNFERLKELSGLEIV